jgi:hypothetical protein
MKSWEDYWKTFDSLIEKLRKDGHEQIIIELKEAQKYVNGLTDGWYDFKIEMENILKLNKAKMTQEQTGIIEFLVKTLNDSLTKSS